MRQRTKLHSLTTKWLHWFSALLLFSIMAEAYPFAFLTRVERATAIPVHASIGLVVLVLMLVRLSYRSNVALPGTPANTPGWMILGAKIGHLLLYFLFLFLAVIGLWMAASSEADIRLFGTFNVSALAPANPELIAILRPVHLTASILFGLVLFGHIMGALWHHFITKDDVLIRMLPFSGVVRRESERGKIVSWRFPSANKVDWHDRRTWFVER